MFAVALDLLRQAVARRWVMALGLAVTAALLLTGLSLRLDVVDGALSATRLFGQVLARDVVAIDVALRPVFSAAAYLIVYGFTAFLVLATADFGPSLLLPGRIEHLLALPVRRWELLVGTYVGVCLLATMAAGYGAGGLTLVLGAKTGVWTLRPLLAGLMGVVAFATVYAVMLTTAVLVRSAAVSAAVGAAFYVTGIVAGFRDAIAAALDEGFIRTGFLVASAVVPRLSQLAGQAATFAGGQPVGLGSVAAVLTGFVMFAAGVMTFGVWLFERKDY